MSKETLQKAFESGDLDDLLGDGLPYLYPTHNDGVSSYDKEVVDIVKDYLIRLLEPIAKQHGIKAEMPETLSNGKKELEKIKKDIENPKNNNEDALSDIEWKLEKVYKSLAAGWVFYFVEGSSELQYLLKNPELKSETAILLEQLEEADKKHPLEEPLRIFIGGPDDWEKQFDDSMYRLETPEEVKARVAEVKQARYEALKIASTIDHEGTFKKWWSFVNFMPETKDTFNEISDNMRKVNEKKHIVKLEGHKKDEKFYKDVLEIMKHDKTKNSYWYHGTQDAESGYSIVKQGLVMASKELGSTAYCEFTPEQLLTYSRGFAGEIGEHGVVIISQPRGEKGLPIDIVKKNNTNIEVVQSGLGGFKENTLKYMIPSKYIVGYVDKLNHKVVKNPEYFNNLQTSEPKVGLKN